MPVAHAPKIEAMSKRVGEGVASSFKGVGAAVTDAVSGVVSDLGHVVTAAGAITGTAHATGAGAATAKAAQAAIAAAAAAGPLAALATRRDVTNDRHGDLSTSRFRPVSVAAEGPDRHAH